MSVFRFPFSSCLLLKKLDALATQGARDAAHCCRAEAAENHVARGQEEARVSRLSFFVVLQFCVISVSVTR
jgi:hypothetical protein